MHCSAKHKALAFALLFHTTALQQLLVLSPVAFWIIGGVKWTGFGVFFGNLLEFEVAFAPDRFDDGTLVLTAVRC